MNRYGVDVLTPEVRLLLACSRLRPCQEQLSDCVREVKAWHKVIELARHHMIVPLVHRHLTSLLPEALPVGVMAELGVERRKIVQKSLSHRTELRQLVKNYLQPRNIRFLVLKGLTLAQRYYGDPALRQGRDIDILVDPARLYELTAALLQAGYRLVAASSVNSDAALQAYCAMTAEVNVISPRGVLIELHQVVDFTGCQYPVKPNQLFACVETVTLEENYPVLPTTELFLYICYHHSRHQWSRLHWVADLDALVAHPGFDRGNVLKRAQALGMGKIVQAALILHAALGGQVQPSSVMNPFARRLIGDSLFYLQEGNLPPEQVRIRSHRTIMGLWRERLKAAQFNWWVNTRLANRLCFLVALGKPSYCDYLFCPLPPTFFVLYRFIRPLRWLLEALGFVRNPH